MASDQQLYQQIVEYNQACEQYKAAITTCISENARIESYCTEMENALKDTSLQQETSEKLMEERNQLDNLRVKAEQAAIIIEGVKQSIPNMSKLFSETTNDHYNGDKMKNLKGVVLGLRKLYQRKNNLIQSIEYLEKAKANLEEDGEDLKSDLQEARNWSKDVESEILEKSQGILKMDKHLKEQIGVLESKNKDVFQQYSDANTLAKINFTDISMFSSHYTRSMAEFQESLAEQTKISKPNEAYSFYVPHFQNELNRLDQRNQVYQSMFTYSYILGQLRDQNKFLEKDLQEVSALFNNEYEETKKLMCQIAEEIKFKIGIERDMDEFRKQYDNSNIFFDQKEREEMAQKSVITELQIRLTQREAERAEIDSRIDKRVMESYQIETRKAKTMDAEISVIKHQKVQNESLIKELRELNERSEGAKRKFLFYKTNNNPVIFSEVSKEFFHIATIQSQRFRELTVKNAAAQKEYEESTKASEQSLDQLIQVCRKKREIIQTKANESDNFENPGLRVFMPKDTIYTPETGNKVLLDTASMEAMVCILFNPLNKEPKFMETHLFAWHNAFVSTKQIIDILILCCHNANQQKPIGEGADPLLPSDIVPVFDNYIKLWILMFPYDFLPGEGYQPFCELFDVIKSIGIDCTEYNQQIELIQKENYTPSPPTPILDFNVYDKPFPQSGLLQKFGSLNQNSLPFCLEADAHCIAQHLTYYELKVFNSIHYREFIKCGWSKPNRDITSPNLSKLTSRFNTTSSFISYSIVSEFDLTRRACILTGWIKIMEQAQAIHNFNLIFEIDGSLNNPAITRLAKTWNKINEIEPGIKEKYEEFSKLTSPFRKFSKYKAELTKSKVEETIPYLGPWLTEMTFVQDGNPTNRAVPSGANGYNITKQRYYAAAVFYLKKNWGSQYQFDLSKSILDKVEKLSVPDDMGDTKLFTLSSQCEE